jgi:hypothetical protein
MSVPADKPDRPSDERDRRHDYEKHRHAGETNPGAALHLPTPAPRRTLHERDQRDRGRDEWNYGGPIPDYDVA